MLIDPSKIITGNLSFLINDGVLGGIMWTEQAIIVRRNFRGKTVDGDDCPEAYQKA